MHAINSIPNNVIEKIVRCVEDAVGDDIKADIRQNELETTNSVPSRIWDLLNTSLIKTLNAEDCTVVKGHRGPWQMVVVFDKTTECIFTLMREKRFSELCRRQRNRKQMHYVDMLAKQFNKDLVAASQQYSFFPHSFSDEEKLVELVGNLLNDLGSDRDLVRNHVLILFDTVGYQLTSIRSIMVTPTLDIAENSEQNWSSFIEGNTSTIVEKVDDLESPVNHPNRGLTFKTSALERKGNNAGISYDNKDLQKQDETC